MDKEIVVRLHSSFEDMVRKHPDTGTEFWCARDHFAHISKMVARNRGRVSFFNKARLKTCR